MRWPQWSVPVGAAMQLELTRAQASFLFWLLQGTLGSTDDRGTALHCRRIIEKLSKKRRRAVERALGRARGGQR